MKHQALGIFPLKSLLVRLTGVLLRVPLKFLRLLLVSFLLLRPLRVIPVGRLLLRLVDCLGEPPYKGWIAQMEEHWYGDPEVLGASPGSVKFSLPIFQIFLKYKGKTNRNERVIGKQMTD